MSTWEERMAGRAAARAARAARERPDPPDPPDPHAGHHEHLRGTAAYCSCGLFRGVMCVAIPDDYDPDAYTCGVCGARGVVGLPEKGQPR